MTERIETVASTALAELWTRIRRPIEAHAALSAVVGLPERTSRQLISAAVSSSAQANRLLAAMPHLIRGLSISTTSIPERVVGEVRGPVLWSETLSARAASAGDPGVFVCSTTTRAYDTPSNRLLVAALEAIIRGGRDVDRLPADQRRGQELFEVALHNADVALRFRDHRTLIDVRAEHSRRRPLGRVKANRRRRDYQPVIEMLALAAEPIDADTVAMFCDARTTALHDLMMGTVHHLERRGVEVPRFLVADHALVAGPVRLLHPDHPSTPHPGGVRVGPTLLTIPALVGDEADDHVVVRTRADMMAVVDDVVTSGVC